MSIILESDILDAYVSGEINEYDVIDLYSEGYISDNTMELLISEDECISEAAEYAVSESEAGDRKAAQKILNKASSVIARPEVHKKKMAVALDRMKKGLPVGNMKQVLAAQRAGAKDSVLGNKLAKGAKDGVRALLKLNSRS